MQVKREVSKKFSKIQVTVVLRMVWLESHSQQGHIGRGEDGLVGQSPCRLRSVILL